MDIRPPLPDPLRGQSSRPAPESRPGAPVRREGAAGSAAPAEPRDRVEISADVRELQERMAVGDVPAGTMAPERLREVIQRLADGLYDSPQVLDRVVERLPADLRREE
jgi:hypothetical protein